MSQLTKMITKRHKITGWVSQWNQTVSHYLIDGYVVCGTALKTGKGFGIPIPIKKEDAIKLCKKCLRTITTYNDLDNYVINLKKFPQPEPVYTTTKKQ